MPWSLQPKVKEKVLKTGRVGAQVVKPTSALKTGGAFLAIPFDVIRAPKAREVNGGSQHTKESLKKLKHRLSFISGDEDGDFVMVGNNGRGSVSNTPGRKTASKIPKIVIRRPASVMGLDLLAGNERYSLRASASLYTLADTDTDETDVSHHITPFILSDYDASTPPLSSSSLPSPASSASLYTQSSSSSSRGPSFRSFSYPSPASSMTTYSLSPSPSLRASFKSMPSRLNLDLPPPKLDRPEDWFATPLSRSPPRTGWFISPDRDSYEKEK